MAVSAVNDDIARLKDRNKLLDEVIDCLTSLDKKQDLSGSCEVVCQFLDAVASDDVLSLGSAACEGIYLLDCSVVDSDCEALGLHIHNKVLTHYGETD